MLLEAQDLRLGAEQDQLSGDCQDTETSMVRVYHEPRQALKKTVLQGPLDSERFRGP